LERGDILNAEERKAWEEIVRINHDVPSIQAADAELKRLREDNKRLSICVSPVIQFSDETYDPKKGGE
jgi:hypothetical protein